MINLDGRQFSPVQNSESGRVTEDAVFTFKQKGKAFSAVYSGSGFTDGHLIGNFQSGPVATLIYHSRSETGELEAGKADAVFELTETGKWSIAMNWQWLNGSQKTGTSFYKEL